MNHRAAEVANYANAIVGKTITIVRTPELKVGDVVIILNTVNVGYEKPLKINKFTRVTDDFFDIEFAGCGTRELSRFARTCIFGMVVGG